MSGFAWKSRSEMPSRKIRAMRKATGSATSKNTISGNEKQGAYRPKPVTLPTLETARRLTKE